MGLGHRSFGDEAHGKLFTSLCGAMGRRTAASDEAHGLCGLDRLVT